MSLYSFVVLSFCVSGHCVLFATTYHGITAPHKHNINCSTRYARAMCFCHVCIVRDEGNLNYANVMNTGCYEAFFVLSLNLLTK